MITDELFVLGYLGLDIYFVESTIVAYLLDLTCVDNQAFDGRANQHYLPEFLHLPTIRCDLGILR